jgi:hypothetical protein
MRFIQRSRFNFCILSETTDEDDFVDYVASAGPSLLWQLSTGLVDGVSGAAGRPSGRELTQMVFTIISKLLGIVLIPCGLLFVATGIGFPILEWIPHYALPKEIIIGILLMVGGKLLYETARVFVVGSGRGY